MPCPSGPEPSRKVALSRPEIWESRWRSERAAVPGQCGAPGIEGGGGQQGPKPSFWGGGASGIREVVWALRPREEGSLPVGYRHSAASQAWGRGCRQGPGCSPGFRPSSRPAWRAREQASSQPSSRGQSHPKVLHSPCTEHAGRWWDTRGPGPGDRPADTLWSSSGAGRCPRGPASQKPPPPRWLRASVPPASLSRAPPIKFC